MKNTLFPFYSMLGFKALVNKRIVIRLFFNVKMQTLSLFAIIKIKFPDKNETVKTIQT